ncbi:MAG TPA: alpha/beta hydrolase [Candidatus Dormibacteraeota bacterium]|jgi:pimeloyl-ACP methyl ester carboxylesterase|nr:alpha/beta hydrolase [Candidatus Dormibacteraeota bacterium]
MTPDTQYTTFDVPVEGGSLAVGEWRGGDQAVLAIHGISSTHRLWSWTAAAAPGVRLIAPDLRGRGASQHVEKRTGLATHRDDMIAVLDHLGIDKVTVAGMSLGGFIAVALAAAVPDRVERLLLVDGGFPMAQAAMFAKLSRDQVAAAFRDRLRRIEQPWASLAEYRDFYLANTAPLLDPAEPILQDYIAYELVGEEPSLTARLDATAIVEDSIDLFLTDSAVRAAESLRVPVRLLFAEWSIGAGSPPAYTAELLAPWGERLAGSGFEATFLPGTDHAATAMTPAAGAVIAGELRRLAPAVPR